MLRGPDSETSRLSSFPLPGRRLRPRGNPPAPGSRNPRPPLWVYLWDVRPRGSVPHPAPRTTLARLVLLRSELISIQSLPPPPVPARGALPPRVPVRGTPPARAGARGTWDVGCGPRGHPPHACRGPREDSRRLDEGEKEPSLSPDGAWDSAVGDLPSCPSSGRQRSPSGPEACPLLCDRRGGTKPSERTLPRAAPARPPARRSARRPGTSAEGTRGASAGRRTARRGVPRLGVGGAAAPTGQSYTTGTRFLGPQGP